jgi:hypothetical protein
MRADHHRRTRGDPRQRLLTRLALLLAGQPFDLDAERLQPVPEIAQMLFGQQLGRRHQCDLIAGLHRGQRSQRGDHRLAAADVALHQPQHRLRLRQIPRDFGADALLRGGQRERQSLEQALAQATIAAQAPAHAACAPPHACASGSGAGSAAPQTPAAAAQDDGPA